MATCRHCGQHGYPPDDFDLSLVFLTTDGVVSGTTPKVTAKQAFRLSCRACGWSILGNIAPDQTFEGIPETENRPTD